MTKVSIIVPVYNEQSTVVALLEKVNHQTVDAFEFEIIVIDDGSQDETVSQLKAHPDLYRKLIERQKNGGKGAAVLFGLEEATGEYILFQDADLEYDPADYAKLLEPVRLFAADIVMGSRLVASPITRVSYFWHKVGNRVITFIFNIFNNTTFTDIYSCYLLYRRDMVEPTKIKSTGWEQQAEILSEIMQSANSIFEVPINYYGRSYDEGKKIRSHHVILIIWMIKKNVCLAKS